ncbi:MAG: molybdenum cofactor biosynthesis protein [Myxococcales bacterium]|nr:molybdenum cofactor biosynthesis protein [Myxococcales bacterium]
MDRALIGDNVAVLTVSDAPTASDDLSGNVIADLASAAAYRVVARQVVASSEPMIRKQLVKWISDPKVDTVIVCGDTELAAHAVAPLITKRLEGFADSQALQCASTLVFLLPPSLEMIAHAVEQLLFPPPAQPVLAVIAPPAPVFVAPLAPVFVAPPAPVFVAPPAPVFVAPPAPMFVAPPAPMFVAPPAPMFVAPPVIAIAPRAPVVRNPRVTTGSIATIGDLPALPAHEQIVDLRAGTKRSVLFAYAAVALAALCAVVMTRQTWSHDDVTAASEPRGDETPVDESPFKIAPAVALPAAPPPATTPTALAATPAAPVAKPTMAVTPRRPIATAPHHPPATKPQPPAPSETSAATTPAPTAETEVQSTCEEASCKLNDYERECCAPFRPRAPTLDLHRVPAEIDRSMVARAIEAVRPRVKQCGSGVTGTVKVMVEVSSDGTVASVVVQKTPEATLGDCVAAVLHDATFPKTENGGSFGYPFAF